MKASVRTFDLSSVIDVRRMADEMPGWVLIEKNGMRCAHEQVIGRLRNKVKHARDDELVTLGCTCHLTEGPV